MTSVCLQAHTSTNETDVPVFTTTWGTGYFDIEVTVRVLRKPSTDVKRSNGLGAVLTPCSTKSTE